MIIYVTINYKFSRTSYKEIDVSWICPWIFLSAMGLKSNNSDFYNEEDKQRQEWIWHSWKEQKLRVWEKLW